MLFLIDKPYVSDFLIKTLRKNAYPVVSTAVSREMIKNDSLNWIASHTKGSELTDKINLFKDKSRFRELIRSLYPDFIYRTVKLNDIPYLSLDGIAFPFVIKPSVGFFSLGVHIVRDLEGLFPPSVLNSSTFIIEEFIPGEEFAGDVVILNIFHHRFSSGNDTSDRVYSTSRAIVLSCENAFAEFLNARGKIIPIEVNPLRFGGWCTTADLPGIALGYNLYEYFYDSRKPDWEQIFQNGEDKLYSIVVLNNNSGIPAARIKSFDHDLLGEDFENTLMIRKLDIKEYPVFGFLFAETSAGNKEELSRILVSDLKKYIITE